jgi:hypothetical protein
MATNRDLLKEAIADAKSVKETAIANAKAALEEAFTPYLKEKLSAKLQEMEEEETKMEGMYEDEAEEMMEEKESMDEISLDELLAELEGEEMEESIFEAKEEEEEEESEEIEDDEEESEEEMPIGDMTPEEFEKFMRPEIEKVIQAMINSGELEAGHEGMENEEGAEEVGAEEEEIDEDININEFLDEDLDEEVSLDELLAELEEGDVYEEDVYEEGVKNEMQEELEEAYDAIRTLKSELNEINLLNAKLLYTNKIFRNKSLTESQKVKVLTAFDKATSKKEAQLVYETLLENLKTPVKKSPIQESLGSASKALGTAKSKPIIENDAFSRMRELAFGNNK